MSPYSTTTAPYSSTMTIIIPQHPPSIKKKFYNIHQPRLSHTTLPSVGAWTTSPPSASQPLRDGTQGTQGKQSNTSASSDADTAQENGSSHYADKRAWLYPRHLKETIRISLILKYWYGDRLQRPFLHELEKRQLKKLTRLSLGQIGTWWFSTRVRNAAARLAKGELSRKEWQKISTSARFAVRHGKAVARTQVMWVAQWEKKVSQNQSWWVEGLEVYDAWTRGVYPRLVRRATTPFFRNCQEKTQRTSTNPAKIQVMKAKSKGKKAVRNNSLQHLRCYKEDLPEDLGYYEEELPENLPEDWEDDWEDDWEESKAPTPTFNLQSEDFPRLQPPPSANADVDKADAPQPADPELNTADSPQPSDVDEASPSPTNDDGEGRLEKDAKPKQKLLFPKEMDSHVKRVFENESDEDSEIEAA